VKAPHRRDEGDAAAGGSLGVALVAELVWFAEDGLWAAHGASVDRWRRAKAQGGGREAAGVGFGAGLGHHEIVKRRHELVIAFASALGAFAPAARASPVDPDLAAARALFHEAELDEQGARWAQALVKLRRASAVKMTPGLRFHIAVCEERLGQLVAALDDFTAAQAAARDENNREVLGLVSDPLLAIKLRVPTLTVELPPALRKPEAAAEVRLDGALVPRTSVGVPLPVDVGSHTLQANAPGYAPYAVTVTLIERQAATVHVDAVASITHDAPGPALTKPEVGNAPSSSGNRSLAIAMTAGAVVLAAAGVGAYVAAGSDASYWQGACQGEGPSCGNKTPVRAWDGAALGAWLAAGGAAAVAVVLWARPVSGDSGTRAELRAAPGALCLSGTF
jgi:hypothetical protein